MRFSDRALSIQPFLAMEFGQRAATLEGLGANVIKLNIGEPDFGAPAPVVQAMEAALRGMPLGYTSALGLQELREAIAQFYKSTYGVTISPSRVVVTAGASAALLLVTAALVNPGDKVLVGDPSYPCNRQFLAGYGADVELVPTTAASRFQLDAALVQAHWSEAVRGLMIASPGNPTGTSVPLEELSAICSHARANGAWRIVDEIYLGLADRGPDGRPPATVLTVDPDAIVINSFSKYFGMTGWRLGWCVVPAEMVPVMERLAQNYYICPSTLAQHAALGCFRSETIAICEQRRTELEVRRTVVLDGLARIGLPVPVLPDGAFYVYFNVAHTGLSAMEFCLRALEEAHVALTPGNDFGPCGGTEHVRLSYAASVDELKEGLKRLSVFMSQFI
ncbi:aminotransferase class I/II-fold pyridoxal phosphate-dependent enzyme [Pseudomonas sp. SIMBA_059]|uniref:aminotransferase class I/II-fold pyridoxal phosphate-dependent enzyme n=2 Tax=Bacteria TaxID=2 RepID=UPI0018E68B66|nr:aminotransferase class I/II-fold pyridoxal phosphate-dependent enzyme [Pseudomonas palleroniana]MBI6906807.1 aminotransferase class I/II-fold pyridoxal phosphate-dependent enzyme [Pseudomonas palleroniana]